MQLSTSNMKDSKEGIIYQHTIKHSQPDSHSFVVLNAWVLVPRKVVVSMVTFIEVRKLEDTHMKIQTSVLVDGRWFACQNVALHLSGTHQHIDRTG